PIITHIFSHSTTTTAAACQQPAVVPICQLGDADSLQPAQPGAHLQPRPYWGRQPADQPAALPPGPRG
ncbi:hypothetical protein HaLaN_03005, partial [Haematococcus lacustris]